MKKILSVVLCAFMLLGVFAATASAADAAVPTDLRKFGAYGQDHIFLGDPIVMGFPVADGVIGDEEYKTVHEVKNIYASDIASEEYMFEHEDVISWTQYFSYDADGWLYHAVKVVTPDYAIRKDDGGYGNSGGITLAFNDSGDFWSMMTRTSITMQGREKNGQLVEGGYISGMSTATYALSKEGALTMTGWDDATRDAEIVPNRYHTATYDETTKLYTCVWEYKINVNAWKINQGAAADLEAAKELKSAMIWSSMTIRSRKADDSGVNELGYYTQGTALSAQEIDAIDQAYEDSTYVPGSNLAFPDMLHFFSEPTDEAEYVALTGGRPGSADRPDDGGDGSGTIGDGDVDLEEEENEDEKADDKKDDKAPETTKAPEEEKKGCKGAIGSGALALVATVGCGVTVISRKKRK